MENGRKSNIELLRIIMALGVIILHYNNSKITGAFNYVRQDSINQYYLIFTESLFVCAVNVFIMISGYFLCMTAKRRFVKVIELVLQVILFNAAGYLIRILITELEFTFTGFLMELLPRNYYVILYLVLYIISPYLNCLITKLDRRQFNKLIIECMLVFSLWSFAVDILENICNTSLQGLSSIGSYGSQYGYTIVNFVLVYLI